MEKKENRLIIGCGHGVPRVYAAGRCPPWLITRKLVCPRLEPQAPSPWVVRLALGSGPLARSASALAPRGLSRPGVGVAVSRRVPGP